MKKEKSGKILLFYTNEWLAELCYFAAPAAEWLHTPSPPSSPNYSGLNELPDQQHTLVAESLKHSEEGCIEENPGQPHHRMCHTEH